MRRRSLSWLVCVLAVCSWFVGAFAVQTFDFDEALYRRMAEEMKFTGNYLRTSWDGDWFYEKPPTYFWVLNASSALIDGTRTPEGPGISVFAARLPNILFTLGIALLLSLSWGRIVRALAHNAPGHDVGDGHSTVGQLPATPAAWTQPTFPFLVFCCALLPTLGARTVLLDPLITLLMTPTLVIGTLLWISAPGGMLRKPRPPEVFAMAIGMGLAATVKGPIGLILPGLAFGLRMLASPRTLVRNALTMAPTFLLGFCLAGAFYVFLYLNGAQEFIYQFFVKYHFKLGTAALQGHQGPVIYHTIVLIVGGALATSLALRAAADHWANRQTALSKPQMIPTAALGFPLAWVVGVVGFFSAMTTKLPNYIWPAWPALALFTALLLAKNATTQAPNEKTPVRPFPLIRGVLTGMSRVVPGLLALAFLVVGLFIDSLWPLLKMDYRAKAVLEAVGPWPLSVRAGFVGVGLLFGCGFVVLERVRSDEKRVVSLAAFTALIGVLIAGVIAPFAADKAVGPIERLASISSTSAAEGGTHFATVGMFSPAASLAYGRTKVVQYASGDETPFTQNPAQVILLPNWNEELCGNHGLHVVARDLHFLLCAEKKLGASQDPTTSPTPGSESARAVRPAE